MKRTIVKILRSVLAYGFLAFIFIRTLIISLQKGHGIGIAILSAIFITLIILLIIGLLIFLWWRLFTAEGREAEKEAEARSYIKKLERKRDREWHGMNNL